VFRDVKRLLQSFPTFNLMPALRNKKCKPVRIFCRESEVGVGDMTRSHRYDFFSIVASKKSGRGGDDGGSVVSIAVCYYNLKLYLKTTL